MTGRSRVVALVAPVDGGVSVVAERTGAALRAAGWAVRTIPVPRTDRSALRVAVATAWRHRAALRRADVVHAEFGRLDAEVFWLAALLVRLRPVVLVAHDAPAHVVKHPAARIVGTSRRWRSRIGFRVLGPLLDRPVLRAVVRRARVGVVLTPDARDGWGPTGPPTVLVAPHGADPPSPSRLPPSAGTHVLFAGFLGPSKGLDVLLDAWEQVGAATGLPLRIAGAPTTPDDAAWVEGLRRRAWPAGAEPEWLGAVDDDAWPALFARAAIVVLPYRVSNPASGILVRAMVEGRPVIATPVQAVAAVGDDRAFALVPTDDAEALGVEIARLAASGDARDDLGGRAAARAAELWSWDRQVSALETAYGLALTPGPPPAAAA